MGFLRTMLLLPWRHRRVFLVLLIAAGASGVGIWQSSPFPLDRLLEPPGGPVVLDREGRVIHFGLSADQQWCLPVQLEEVSPALRQAVIAVEDSRFAEHAGVDGVAVVRAVGQNLGRGRVVSGASTVTMQLCRMLEPRQHSYPAKLREAVQALRAERLLSKDQILEHYLNRAPFGGNIRGVEAASRIWFGKPAAELELAEAALLAGLPQSPSRLRPDRYPERAAARRAKVLARMVEEGMIDLAAAQEAGAAPVRVRRLEDYLAGRGREPGRHLAEWVLARRPRGAATTIDLPLQERVERAARRHASVLPPGTDAAVVVTDLASGEIRALVGSADFADPVDGQVNGAWMARAPGELLRPLARAGGLSTSGWADLRWLYADLGLLHPGNADATAEELGGGRTPMRLVDLAAAFGALGRGGDSLPWTIFPNAAAEARPVLEAGACADLARLVHRGTGFGRRDGWAAACDDQHAVAVWVGRFSGRGPAVYDGGVAARLLNEVLDQAQAPDPERDGADRLRFPDDSGRSAPIAAAGRGLELAGTEQALDEKAPSMDSGPVGGRIPDGAWLRPARQRPPAEVIPLF